MSDEKLPKRTQRAYTLRLSGLEANDNTWRKKLWTTHEAVNRGAKAFGDWLLTLRGGLSHTLVDDLPFKKPTKKGPTEEQQKKDRRVVLALSWLSVESQTGALKAFTLRPDDEGKQDTVQALREILASRGLGQDETEAWVEDCSGSLGSAIREDAVWINRSKAFDAACGSIVPTLTRDQVWDLLGRFFASTRAYLELKREDVGEDGGEGAGGTGAEKAKDLVQKAGQWLSSRFGTGKGADFAKMADVYDKIAEWAESAQSGNSGAEAIRELADHLGEFAPASEDLDGVLHLISGPGYDSATRHSLSDEIGPAAAVLRESFVKLKDRAQSDVEKCRSKVGDKGHRPWSDKVLETVERQCGFTYLQEDGPARHSEFAVMLDHAARHVSVAHSWVKRAEARRILFEEEGKRINKVPDEAKRWLDAFCEERLELSGAIDEYVIRKRAVTGWKELVVKWARPDCKTEEDRINAIHELQADPELEKFGEEWLFRQLAADDALCVWQENGKPAPEVLLNYVAARLAEWNKRRFKVPAYRHPDALRHPVFCDFGNSRWHIAFDIHAASKEARKGKRRKGNFNPSALTMGLFDGRSVGPMRLKWRGKRARHDLELRESSTTDCESVTRSNRLGRAAAGVSQRDAVAILDLFEQNDWNGRLQAPRAQLDAMALYLEKHGRVWDAKAMRMRAQLQWLITLSAKLQPQGPWVDYANRMALPISSFAHAHPELNKNRKGHAKLILSRLPGLRVLSVDLGHRYAASCAVWETLSCEQVAHACGLAGRQPPGPDDLYLHLRREVSGQHKTTIYRRIGPDFLDGQLDEAPWARLDRQFSIKLQGEEDEARRATDEELESVEYLEAELGKKPPEKRDLHIGELMWQAVRTVQLGLRRHGDIARIGHDFTATDKLLPGGKKAPMTEEDRRKSLADALAKWHARKINSRWADEWAKKQWKAHMEPRLENIELPGEGPGDETAAQRKARERMAKEKLEPLAGLLAANQDLCQNLHDLWADHWAEEDSAWRNRLRWLRDWIMPRGSKANSKMIRRVGGLSLARITTIQGLYRVQKAFKNRPTPSDPRANIPGKWDDSLAGFGKRILNAMERMRENRVKQIASRIVEAALGVGIERKRQKGYQKKRPRERIAEPCHAIVIENLEHYRTDELQTRRENRQLMSWSSGKIRDRLMEACELYGLKFWQVFPSYTSQQDSRTGAPGVRCNDIAVEEFMADTGFWHTERTRARNRLKKNHFKRDAPNARDWYLIELYSHLKFLDREESKRAGFVRIPQRKGGQLFVSADSSSPAAKGIQADLNAAANIGLKALLDPDWPGKWWFVPCDRKTLKPARDKTDGCAALNPSVQLKGIEEREQTKGASARKRGRKRAIANLWRDVSVKPVEQGEWLETKAYWDKARYEVIQIFRKQAGLKRDDELAESSGDLPFFEDE